MATHRHINKLCAAATVFALLLTFLLMNGEALGMQAAARVMGYENRLFDTGFVHSIDIVMDGWEDFLDTCEDEEYVMCSLVIDGELYKNVAIRAKGNTSLRTVSAMGSSRYSFKIEFDAYDSTNSYHGLDKLCLNNMIQDTTYMKDYLTYQMMGAFGVDAPLCSYAYITVNGEDWGLYLAVEGVEEAFLERNYGSSYGELYKPDSQNTAKAGFGSSFGGMGSSDVKLQYTDDNPDSYSNIFDNAKTNITEQDKSRLIRSLQALNENQAIEKVVNIDEVLRYFVVHNFVCNDDSYTGTMVHNYYLYEENGRLSMIPWDYNLAFGTFQPTDAAKTINSPIDTPVSGSLDDRPMLAWIFNNTEYTEAYHQYFADFLESTDFTAMIEKTSELIGSYVQKDATGFYGYEAFETGTAALKEFCLLRAESIRGQLAGDIPSTTEGQNTDSSALIDASHLTLSDMGSMNDGMGNQRNDMQNTPEDMGSPPTGMQNPPEGMDSPPTGMQNPPDGIGSPPTGIQNPPDGMDSLPDNTENLPDDMQSRPDGMGSPPDSEHGSPDSNTLDDAREAFAQNRFPHQENTSVPVSAGGAALLLLGISVLVLLTGLLIAFRYKR